MATLLYRLAGYGEKPNVAPVTGAMDVLVALEDFIDHEFDGQKFAVVGYSFGGLLVTALAEKYGDRMQSVFLIAPEIVPEKNKRSLPDKTVFHISALDPAIPEDELSAYKAIVVHESQENFNQYKRYILSGINANINNPVLKYLSARPALDKEPADYMHTYKGRVSIVVGKNDDMVGYKDAFAFYSNLNDADFISISKAGHILHLDEPEIVGSAFRTWLHNIQVCD